MPMDSCGFLGLPTDAYGCLWIGSLHSSGGPSHKDATLDRRQNAEVPGATCGNGYRPLTTGIVHGQWMVDAG